MAEVRFDRDKLIELIVYIAEKTADDEWFGDTHLNKVLYWADFEANKPRAARDRRALLQAAVGTRRQTAYPGS